MSEKTNTEKENGFELQSGGKLAIIHSGGLSLEAQTRPNIDVNLLKLSSVSVLIDSVKGNCCSLWL